MRVKELNNEMKSVRNFTSRRAIETWRVSLSQRSFAAAGGFLIFCMGLWMATSPPSSVNSRGELIVGGLIISLVGLVGAWRLAFHPRLIANETGLLIIGVFFRKVLTWDEISMISSDREGLRFWTSRRADPFLAWVGQRAQAFLYGKKGSPADRMAHQIVEIGFAQTGRRIELDPRSPWGGNF